MPTPNRLSMQASIRTVRTVDERAPLAATSLRLVCFSISMAVAITLFELSLLIFVPLNTTCELPGDIYPNSLSVPRTPLILLPPFLICPWLTGAVVTFFAACQHRVVSESMSHFWTTWYCRAAFASSFLYLVDMVNWCSSALPMSMDLVWHFSNGFLVLMEALCVLISLFRLRRLAAISPVMARAGEVSGICSICLYTVEVIMTAAGLFNLSRARWILLLTAFLLALFYGIVVAVLSLSAKMASKEALQSDVDNIRAPQLAVAAKWMRIMMITTAAAGTTSVAYPLVIWVFPLFDVGFVLLVWLAASSLMTNVVASAFLSGLVVDFDGESRSTHHINVGATCIGAQRRREIETQLCENLGLSTGSALTIASLMDGADPHDCFREAESRFRCIRWDVLAKMPGIIIAGGPLDGLESLGNDLYSLSEPCQLGACDFFFSHSWRDCGRQKWEALESACESFMLSEGRYPRLWLDKVCINQFDIAKDLQCLPVFVGACNTILVASGPTYPTRLWCAVELLVYRAMMTNDACRHPPKILILGDSDEQRELHRQAWCDFDVGKCDCFNQEDKNRFLRVVAHYPGCSAGFNQFIREIAADLELSIKRSYDFTERC